jgi:hypothetical protein
MEAPALVDPERLLRAICDDLKICREAALFDSLDEVTKERHNVELSALTTHLIWTESVGNNQPELERIIHSLEANPFLRKYQRWRSRSG